MPRLASFLLAASLAVASAFPGPAAAAPADGFLARLLVPGPAQGTLLALSHPDAPGVATYDVALAALWALDLGRPEEAGRLLVGLAALQRPDGGLPFSFQAPRPAPGATYVRSGAVAWAGYAAARWLSATGPEVAARPLVAGLARGCAAYLLERRVASPGDPRDGLITGGEGRYVYAREGDRLQERFEPGPMAWVSAEHNVDAWFCLQALHRALGEAPYRAAAVALGQAVVARLWDDAAGQFHQGALAAPDRTQALDCAAWGAVFLAAAGEPGRARRALAATTRYAARDQASGATGYRPYRGRPLIESWAAREFYRAQLPPGGWDEVEAVWPEGTAGVALAALRLGEADRARMVLDGLAPLRGADGGLPGLTLAIPTEFTTRPALAGTAWDALVRAELARGPQALGLWSETL